MNAFLFFVSFEKKQGDYAMPINYYLELPLYKRLSGDINSDRRDTHYATISKASSIIGTSNISMITIRYSILQRYHDPRDNSGI